MREKVPDLGGDIFRIFRSQTKGKVERQINYMMDECRQCGDIYTWGQESEFLRLDSGYARREWTETLIDKRYDCPVCEDLPEAMVRNLFGMTDHPVWQVRKNLGDWEIKSPDGWILRVTDRDDILDRIPSENPFVYVDTDEPEVYCGEWWTIDNPPSFQDIDESTADEWDGFETEIPDVVVDDTTAEHRVWRSDGRDHWEWLPERCPQCGESGVLMWRHETEDGPVIVHRPCGNIIRALEEETSTEDILAETQEILE